MYPEGGVRYRTGEADRGRKMAEAQDRTARAAALQRPRDVAVVMPTLLRPSLLRAVESVYAQNFPGTIHLLIGVDRRDGDARVIDAIRRKCPDRVTVTVLDPGYSTSAWNGGVHPARDGGALRTVLSYLANARLLAYLDDDNWWAADHLSSLARAVEGKAWAYSLRWYVDAETQRPLCVDEWESVGPDRGVYAAKAGGFVDPNCLMIDKLACEPVLRLWSNPMFPESGDGADRNVFRALRSDYDGAATGLATAYYVIHPADPVHPYRQGWIAEKTGGKGPAAP